MLEQRLRPAWAEHGAVTVDVTVNAETAIESSDQDDGASLAGLPSSLHWRLHHAVHKTRLPDLLRHGCIPGSDATVLSKVLGRVQPRDGPQHTKHGQVRQVWPLAAHEGAVGRTLGCDRRRPRVGCGIQRGTRVLACMIQGSMQVTQGWP